MTVRQETLLLYYVFGWLNPVIIKDWVLLLQCTIHAQILSSF